MADSGRIGQWLIWTEAVVDAGCCGQMPLSASALAGDSPNVQWLLCGRVREVQRLLQTAVTVVGGYDGRYNYE